MPSFNYLTPINFEDQLKLFNVIKASIKPEHVSILIESTFLQMYAQLEGSLYQECEKHVIKKNASIARFENALNELGYVTNTQHWEYLIHLSKIRNCLLHGNGRLDNDKYGEDTRNTIHCINLDANEILIEIVHLPGQLTKIKLLENFPNYCFTKIYNFIHASASIEER